MLLEFGLLSFVLIEEFAEETSCGVLSFYQLLDLVFDIDLRQFLLDTLVPLVKNGHVAQDEQHQQHEP